LSGDTHISSKFQHNYLTMSKYIGSFFSVDSFFYLEHFTNLNFTHGKFGLTVGYRTESNQFFNSPFCFSPRGGLKFQATEDISFVGQSGVFYQFPFQDAVAFRRPPVNIFAYRKDNRSKNHQPEKFIKNELGIYSNNLLQSRAALIIYHLYSDNTLTSYGQEGINQTTNYTTNEGKIKSDGIEFWISSRSGKDRPRFNFFFSGAYHHSRVFRNEKWKKNLNDFRWNFQLIVHFKPASWFRIGTMLNAYQIPREFNNYRFLINYHNLDKKVYFNILEDDNNAYINYFRWDIRLQFLLKDQLFLTIDFINITNQKNLYMSTFYKSVDNLNHTRLGITHIYNIPFLIFGGLEFSF